MKDRLLKIKGPLVPVPVPVPVPVCPIGLFNSSIFMHNILYDPKKQHDGQFVKLVNPTFELSQWALHSLPSLKKGEKKTTNPYCIICPSAPRLPQPELEVFPQFSLTLR